jgi:hypothetical protein
MERHGLWIALMTSLIVWPSIAGPAQRTEQSSSLRQEAPTSATGQQIVRGRVQVVHASRLFTVEDRIGRERDVIVLAPDARATPAPGATVEAHGVFRPLEGADLEEVDEGARKRLVGRPVLVAKSLVSATRGEPAPRVAEAPPSEPTGPSPADVPAARRGARIAPTVRPSTLADSIDELAGHHVRVPYARVVGLFDPSTFLIESAMPLPLAIGNRDRVLVLVEGGALRLPAASIVSSTVTVVGVARTLLGVQVTAEVPWPAKLDRETVERLEVRAAILATSVQTADGIELTDRPSTPATANHESPITNRK